MRRSFLAIVTLALMGVVAAFLLVPHRNELGLMLYKDKQFRKAYTLFKERWEQGDHSVEVAVPLSRLYLQYGKIEEAVAMMETFVEECPDVTEAYRVLGTFYQYAQRPDGYLRTLERLRTLAPDADLLRELSDIYSFHSQHKEQAKVLQELIRLKEATSDDAVKLIYLLAALDKFDVAAEATITFIDQHPQEVDIDLLELTASILLEAHHRYGDERYRDLLTSFSETYLSEQLNLSDATRIAGILLSKGEANLGLSVLGHLESAAEQSASSLVTLIELKMAAGREEEVYRQLLEQFHQETLYAPLVPYLVLALMNRHDFSTLTDVIGRYHVELLDDETLIDLAELCLIENSRTVATLIQRDLDTDTLNNYPLLDSLLTLTITPSAGQKEVIDKLEIASLTLTQQRKLLSTLLASNKTGLANYLVTTKLSLSELPIEMLDPLVDHQLRAGQTAQARQYLEQGAVACAGDTWDLLWGRMLFRSGDTDQLLQWASADDGPSASALATLAGVCLDSDNPAIALSVAEVLAARHPKTEFRPVLASTYIANKRYDDALPLYRTLQQRSLLYRKPYLETLSLVAEGDANLTEELHEALIVELEEARQDDDKRAIAYQLLSPCRDKTTAVAIFQDLSETQPPRHPDVQQLLYLWGPRPPSAAKEWIQRRAVAAETPQDLLSWCRALLFVGADKEAVSLLSEKNTPEAQLLVAETLIDRGDFDTFQKQIEAWAPREKNPALLVTAARLAKRAKRMEVAKQLYQRALDNDPDHPDALLELGMVTFEEGHLRTSEPLLERYFLQKESSSRDTDTMLALSYYGAIAWERGQTEKAYRHYTRFLEQLETLTRPSIALQRVEAQALVRTKRQAAGIAAYQNLLAMKPGDADVRATLAHLLMDRGEHDKARRLLEGKAVVR